MVICQCCRLDKYSAYCSSCLQEGISSHVQAATDLRAQCALAIGRSDSLLRKVHRGVDEWRRLRAQVAKKERECAVLQLLLKERQRRLDEVMGRSHATSPFHTIFKIPSVPVTNFSTKEAEIAGRIIHARYVLVNEAINIFGVTQDQHDRWEIAGIVLPDSQRFHVAAQAEVNAALAHIIHLLSLITRYLSITLPYIPGWSRQIHVGRPLIRANTPFLNTTKFREKLPLWLPSTSAHKRDARSLEKRRNFLLAYALLCHSLAYLGWTQGVERLGTEDEAGMSPLRLLRALTRTDSLGRRAHEPGTTMLNHLGFSLDVSTVVGFVLGPDDDHGWDLMEDASALE